LELRWLIARPRRGDRAGQGRAQFIRQETKRPRQALIGYATVRVDQINAVRPARICALRSVAKLIENAGELYTELAHTSSGYKGALVFILRAGEDDLVLYVALHLPDVAGMRFGDIDHQKSHTILVLLIEFVEGRNLPPEWRSSVTAENQNDRLLFIQGGKLNPVGLVHLKQREIRCSVSDLQVSGSGMKPQRLEREEKKDDRSWHSFHDPAEGLRGLIHRPPDDTSESDVNDHQHDGGRTQAFARNWA
jgi:hypothetical protein